MTKKLLWIAPLIALAAPAIAGEPSSAKPSTSEPAGSTVASAPTPEIAKAVLAQQKRFAEIETDQDGHQGAHQYSFDGLMIERVPLAAFAGQTVLVVNTASKCGYTSQYEGLQALHSRYEDQGFSVVGVPSNDFGGQEPGEAQEIAEFCTLNYGVTFPMAAKSVVKGDDAHPFYEWARASFGDDAEPKWNFHKILIAPDGTVSSVCPSSVDPMADDLTSAVEALLKESAPI